MKPFIKKELILLLSSYTNTGSIILFSILSSFFAVKDIFVVGSGSLRPFFSILPWILIVFVPALAMRSFAEEKQTHTLEVLLSLPLSEKTMVIAKFLSLSIISAIALTLTFSVPIGLAFLVKIPLFEVLFSYIGAYFFSLTAISLTLFFSALVSNQALAFLCSVTTLFISMGFSLDFVSSLLPRSVQDILFQFSPLSHLSMFQKGVLDVGDVLYFMATIALYLWYTVLSLKRRS